MQSIRITGSPHLRKTKWNKSIQMNQTNTYIKDLSPLHFEDEARVQ